MEKLKGREMKDNTFHSPAPVQQNSRCYLSPVGEGRISG